MTELELNELKQRILTELDVLEDDIHVTEDKDTMTFYVPTEQLDQAKDLFDRLEVLEDHDYEYLVKIDLEEI
jgi:hypothetical protein